MRDRYQSALSQLKAESLYRDVATWQREGVEIVSPAGDRYQDFSSNDYLGLSQHPKLKDAAQKAIDTYGVGSSASRLICGTSPAHEECEVTIARYKEAECAVLFANGMMAAHGAIKSLFGSDDTIVLDKLSHACLIDAARESGARIRVFPHNNLNRLEELLKSESEKLPLGGKLLVVAESVYSMDGDLAPLTEIVELKERYGAMLLVDEAHGLGVLGEAGMGLAELLGIQNRIDLQMGTLGKAAGGAGGYIACSRTLRQMIINKGRSFIFTTAPPPSQAAVATAALDLIASAEGQEIRSQLSANRQLLAEMTAQELPSAICPIIIGENAEALEVSQRLRAAGFYVPAVRYPTVAKGTARLRITLSALHEEEVIKALVAAL